MATETEFDFIPQDELLEGLRASTSRRQVRTQIYLPLILGLLFNAALVIILISTNFGTVSAWADVSMILLIIPTGIMGVIVLAAFLLLTYGIFRLRHALVIPLRQAYLYLEQFGGGVMRVTDAMTRPWIKLNANFAAVGAFFTGLSKFFEPFKDNNNG